MGSSWQPLTSDSLRGSDAGLRRWLTETGLLTRRLKGVNGADAVSVAVASQTRVSLNAAEAALLGCAVQPALSREIELRAAAVPCIFARTLIPDSTLRSHPWLADLGAMPLGETLENRTDVSRSGFEIARLEADDDLYMHAASRATGHPAALWARRSVFRVGAAGMLVYEVFLPVLGRCA